MTEPADATSFIPISGQSRRLTASDFELSENSTLAGSISRLGDVVTVRIENVTIAARARGKKPLAAIVNRLLAAAKTAGARKLTLEGVSVVNERLAKILIHRYGASYSSQRNLVFSVLLK